MKPRPTLPASSSDFALTPSSSTSNPFPLSAPFPSPAEETNGFMMLRFRRPSLLAPVRSNPQQDRRSHSPLATSFTLPLSRRYSTSIKDETGDESESDKDKMWTDSPPSVDSGATTPSLHSEPSDKGSRTDSDVSIKSVTRPTTPPPRAPAKTTTDPVNESISQLKLRRLSHPIRVPRILTLLAESHPAEAELKSEAQFQRLVASCSDLPLQPRTPRAPSDRGRYPEEADTEDHGREEAPSDDDDDDVSVLAPGFTFPPASEPINIAKPVTPAQSVIGDDFSVESPSAAMDVDIPFFSGSPGMNSWRYTPPPTSSAVRSNKRKFDDRYDPYPTATKRRAVSPSVSLLRESQSAFFPRTPNNSRVPMPIPITIPSGMSSGASSPVVSSFNGSSLAERRSMSIGSASALSSPTLRAQIGLASPILRPMIRARRDTDAAGREVDGAGEGVHGLSLE